jgi:hypothetical protein
LSWMASMLFSFIIPIWANDRTSPNYLLKKIKRFNT